MRALNRLTARAVQSLAADGRYADGGNLFLSIKNGGRSWVFLYRDRARGRLREMGFGPVSSVPLAEARQKAAGARSLLANGVDPLEDKKAKQAAARKARTFGDFCDTEFLPSRLAGLKNEKHRYQWKATLTNDAASLRPMMLHAITADDVRKVLEPIWNVKRETARRLRGRIEEVLDAARAAGLREGDNPARWRGNLKPFFGTSKKIKAHHPAIPYDQMPAFMRELRARDSVSALALEFAILTAARTGEVRFATWSEIDVDKALWTVPADHIKMGRPHRVPLQDRAIQILEKLKRGKPTDYIFPGGKRGKPLSDAAMLECLRDLREGFTVHGFRSTFRDWAGDETSGFPDEIVELALAHGIEDEVERAYRRGDALKKRRELMNLWSRFLAGETGEVVALARKAS